jgi:hypothetical protein
MATFVGNGEHRILGRNGERWTMDYVFSTFLYIMKQYNI